MQARDGGHLQRVRRQAAAIPSGAAVDALDVVGRMKGVRLESLGQMLQSPALEQHDRHVDAAVSGCPHAFLQASEVRRIELLEIELGLAVQSRAGAGAFPRMRRHRVLVLLGRVLRRGPDVPARQFPAPQPDEVVMLPLQEIEVLREIERCGRVAAAHVFERLFQVWAPVRYTARPVASAK